MSGLALYLGIAGVIALLGAHPTGRAWLSRQGWLHPVMAALAVASALAAGFRALSMTGASVVRLTLVLLGGILLGPLVGRLVGIQERLNVALQWGARRLPEYPRMDPSDASRLGVVLLALNPAGWLAAWILGLTDDPLFVAWKAALDGLTLGGLATWRPGPSAVALAAATLVQGLAWATGVACRPWMEPRGLVAPALAASSLVWLTLPLLVLGIRKVPLARLLLAVPTTVLLAAWLG